MNKECTDFLARNGWAEARQTPLAQDASTRRYLRLVRGDETAVLMIAPPQEDRAFQQFIAIAHWLRTNGLSAPRILAKDAAWGLMLLEDFGDGLMASLAGADPRLEPELYAETGRVLAHLSRCDPPEGLSPLGAEELARQTGLLFDEMPNGPSPAMVEDWQAALRRVLQDELLPGPVVALRDLHAENVIWLPDRSGLRRVGLLDFQDAVIAPPGYDLASLVDDPRRHVPDQIRADLIADHARALGHDGDAMAAQIDLLSLARNLRILGIFRRAARLRDRPAYLAFLPRTAWLIRRAARTPAATPLAKQIDWALAQFGVLVGQP